MITVVTTTRKEIEMNGTYGHPSGKVEKVIVDRTLPTNSRSFVPMYHTRVVGIVNGVNEVLFCEEDENKKYLREKSVNVGNELAQKYGCEVFVLK